MIGKYHDGERYISALIREGHKHLHLTFIDDGGVRHATAPREDLRHVRQLTLKGNPYPLSRLVRHFRRIGRERGITESAKTELRRALADAAIADDDTEELSP